MSNAQTTADNNPGAFSYRPPGGHVEVVNRRAVAIGVGVFLLLILAAFAWRLAGRIETVKELQELEFAVEEPVVQKFELQDPQRDIIRETPELFTETVEVDERPDIHVAVVQTDIDITEEVIQVRNIEIEIPKIVVEATDIDIDAPVEIVDVADTIEFAIAPIAAEILDAADIFKYEKINPRDKPLTHLINRAPQPSRNLAALPKAFGDQDVQPMGELGPANINLYGTGDFFRTMTRFGGVHARSAVDSALRWLALHQEADGMWLPGKYDGQDGTKIGVSGLALLALMGGGHTTRKGEYRRNVLRGLEALMKLQDQKDGHIDYNIYSHSIATIALCEAYGRARDERVGAAARKAVAYLEKAANTDGGWRYSANSAISDMSVSGWGIQALKTARLAQIPFDHAVYSRSLLFLDSLTDKGAGEGSSGGVGYTYSPTQSYGAGSPPLTCAGMVVRQFSGVGVKNPLLVNAANLTRKHPPNWLSRSFYMWYYATYAMHNMGGEHRIWWNRRIRDVLLEHQRKDGEHAGSWDPLGDAHGTSGGRPYVTALGALCLEVYYRYSDALNSFGVAPDLDDLFVQ